MNLDKEAAEFYILEYLTAVEEYKPAKPRHNKQIKMLAEEFDRYLAYAIESELSRAGYRVRHSVTKAQRGLISRCKLKTTKDIGLAVKIFNEGYWPGGYGGRRWGTIAETLYAYRKRELSRKLFVDRVWSLRHNNDFVFDKSGKYDYHYLSSVLNFQARGNIAGLLVYCGPTIKKVYRNYEKWRKRCGNISVTAKSKRSRDVRSSGTILMSWGGPRLETRGD